MTRPNVERNVASGIITVTDKNSGEVTQSVTTWDSSYREYYGTVTPGFKTMKTKNLPYNSYVLNIQLNVGSPGSYADYMPGPFGFSYVYTFPSCAMRGGLDPAAWSSSDAMTTARNLATRRLSAKVNELRWNAMQSLAESGQTARLVLQSGRRIAWAALALKRGNLKDMYNALGIDREPSRKEFARVNRTKARDRLAKHWMEYINGWKPLVREVDDALAALAFRLLDDKNLIVRTKSSGSSVKVTQHHNNSWGFNNSEKTVVEKCSVKFLAKYQLTSDMRAFATQYGLSNLPALAWELFPHSYIADWFFNISEYLQSLNAFDGFELVDGQEVTFRRIVAVCNYGYKFSEPNGAQHSSGGNSTHLQVLYTRGPMAGWPTQTLQFRSKFHNETQSKIATIAATLTVLFSPTRGGSNRDLFK